MMKDTLMQSVDVVQEWIHAINAPDMDRIMSHFADTAVDHNMPVELAG